MNVKQLTTGRLDEAAGLAQAAYEAERRAVPDLPEADLKPQVMGLLAGRLGACSAVLEEEDGTLCGYLAFHCGIDGHFGRATGAYAPLYALSVRGKNRARKTTRLFQAVAGVAVPQGVTSYAVTVYAHDRQTASSFVMNGFGIRCADAVRSLSRTLLVRPVAGYQYEEAGPEDAGALLPLANCLRSHLTASPIFMPSSPWTEASWQAHVQDRGSRFFVLLHGGSPVGYLEVGGQGENLLSASPGMANICGAYLSPECRGTGLMDSLLAFACARLRMDGYAQVGVDFETLNPTALRFWSKHFTLYTLSLHRRVDERAVDAGEFRGGGTTHV